MTHQYTKLADELDATAGNNSDMYEHERDSCREAARILRAAAAFRAAIIADLCGDVEPVRVAELDHLLNQTAEHWRRQWPKYDGGVKRATHAVELDIARQEYVQRVASTIAALKATHSAEVASLKARVAELEEAALQRISDFGQLQDIAEENTTLKARIAELEKDAERYRWWRDKSPGSWKLEVDGLPLFKGDLNVAIDRELADAAIAARRKTA